MDLLIPLIAKALENQKITLAFADDTFDLQKSLESSSLAALGKIRDILMDDTLDDPECFQKIEAIVCEYEALGLDCGVRHDFG